MLNLVDGWLRSVQTVIWQSTCVLCGGRGQEGLDLCAECEADFALNAVACGRCAQSLSAGATLVCGACLRRPPRFDAAYCPFTYAYPLDHMVRALKYRGAVAQGRVLSELLAKRLPLIRGGPLPEMLIPVPLAQQRFCERGYNQAIELARYVERRLGIPMRTDIAIRTRETREQAALDGKERRKNIRGAFAALAKPPRHVAILDDVVTTGSTVDELARVLRRAGARRVEVWAVARAGKS